MSQDFGEGAWIKGRKRHRCAGCQGPIFKSELHFQFKGKYENEWQNWRMHAECHAAQEISGDDEVSETPMPDRVRTIMVREQRA